jgi:hypothetical protein
LPDYNSFYASDVYECFRTVPFNKTVALRFLDYYNSTLQFQSTLTYLKNPPSTYKQPSVDVLGELGKIKDKANSNSYANQYDFEAAVQKVVYSMHDGHVDLSAGILSLFSFGSPYFVSSVSKDGTSPPEPYLTIDVLDNYQQEGWTPSPIAKINGQNATDYLVNFAALNSVGTVEPHADWNQLMSSPAQDIQGETNLFSSGGTFYPGHDLNFTLANGTQINTIWTASFDYSGSIPDMTTPLEFFDFFVLGLSPPVASKLKKRANGTATIPAAVVTDSEELGIGQYILRGMTKDFSFNAQKDLQPPKAALSWYNDSYGAYPDNPDIYQPDLGIIGGGVLTAYFFEDISTGILSIPTFQLFDEDIRTFAETVGDFIGNATAKKISKVIIDVQQNNGGSVLLALNTFKQFFPQNDPFAGSRRRMHPNANLLGNTITHWWAQLNRTNPAHVPWIRKFAANEWVLTDRLNADTGKNFTNWPEYAGPKRFVNDDFSLIVRFILNQHA